MRHRRFPDRIGAACLLGLLAVLAGAPVSAEASHASPCAPNTPTASGVWGIDRKRSELGFAADSRFGRVQGVFTRWQFHGAIQQDLTASGRVIVEVSSLTTGNSMRDRHLREPDFLDAVRFPQATYELEKVELRSGLAHRVRGRLTLRGKTQQLVIDLRRSQKAAAIVLTGNVRFSRAAYGIDYKSALNPIEDSVILSVRLVLVPIASLGQE